MAGEEKEIREKALSQSKLKALETEHLQVKGQLDRERLKIVTNSVVDTITSPEFVEKMRLARIEADEGGGLDTAANLLSIDGLRQAGVDIPKDFRLTSRVFEDRQTGFRLELKSDPKLKLGGEEPVLAWGACAGGGGLTFCGCGGFST